MKPEEIKKQLLEKLPNEVTSKLTPSIIAVIDETIESVLDGSTTFDGKKAETLEDVIKLSNYGIIARLNILNKAISTFNKINVENVVINYRGTQLKIK